MPLTRMEINKEIGKLESIVPRMLERSGGARFWVEFLERASDIKARVRPYQRDWVRAEVGKLLAKYNLALPGQESSPAGAMTGRVYSFPTGVRIA